jgi:tetratricopeptide (TPR) repeat protein
MTGLRSLVAGLGVGVLAAAGCKTPERMAQKPEDAPSGKTVRVAAADAPAPSRARGKQKDPPRRTPKASTCVAFGDYRVREAAGPNRTDDEKRHFHEQARGAYRQALDIDPRCVAARRGLALIALAEENHEEAAAELQAALALAPRDAGLWYDLGLIQSRRQEWDPAVAALTRAAEIDPENHQYALALGHCLARSGDYDRAVGVFRRVVGEARAHYNVARMMHHLKQEDLSRRHLRLALEKEPELKEARTLLAQIDRTTPPARGVAPVAYRNGERQ